MIATDGVEIWLVRHGETQTYASDAGLTGRGRNQAHARGVELDDRLPAAAHVVLPHAPTERARATAEALREGLLTARHETAGIGAPYVEPWFDNLRLWCDDRALDPTQAYEPYATLRGIAQDERPSWFDDMDRFASIQAAGDDPITHWLTNPLLAFEPPASVVRRFWDGVVDTVRRHPDASHVVVSTHSGCIRALVAAALGHDPGEPANAESAVIRFRPDRPQATVSYRDQKVVVRVPARYPPPW